MVKGTIPFKCSECGKRFMPLFFAECKERAWGNV